MSSNTNQSWRVGSTSAVSQAAWRELELPALRFLAPLWTERAVGLVGPFGPSARALLQGAARCRKLRDLDAGLEGLDLVLCLYPATGDFLLEQMDRLALATSGEQPALALVSSRSPKALARRFTHAQEFQLRSVSGGMITRSELAPPRVVALAEAGADFAPSLSLLTCSNADLPRLGLGLYSRDETACGPTREVGQRLDSSVIEPVATPGVSRLRREEPSSVRAAALARRLLKVEERTFDLRQQNLRLQRELASQHRSGALTQGAFDVPRQAFPWPLAENPAADPASLGLYDRRVDDGVVAEARIGETFLERHSLLGDEPAFSEAVAELQARAPTLRLAAAEETPDISIVIPVYGQLPYTLNCLDSLLSHQSKYSAEIIIIDDCSPDRVTEEFLPGLRHIVYHRQPKNGGFINSCNTGGAMSRGRYVLMLNNDTRLVSGWLDALLDSFASLPNAGLVGSKMCYPDGALQEAGGILWRDGSAWNYGRNDDPNRPQYCYAREVDYISGCSIALPSALWRRLGGFDAFFSPAYAEDADLCQRVAAAGYSVWYQPQSRVIHYEGKTSGTNTAGGVKAYQVVNLKKLYLRWRDRFEAHRPNGEAPFLERERSVHKRFLVVDAVTPTPDQDAGSLQTVLGLRCCRDSGYKTHFVPEDNWLFEPDYTPALQREGIDCAYAPYEVGFDNYIRRYGWSFDVVMVYRIAVAERIIDAVRRHAPQAIILFHVADLHYLRMERQAELEQSEALAKAAADLKQRELDLVRRADCTITHSTVEKDILADEAPGAKVVTWPLMMEHLGTTVPFELRRDICFLGGYKHPPNVDAVKYFTESVLPLIKAKLPEVRFIVAGANPTPEVEQLAREDVIVTGRVEDLREVFDRARVFVCPLRIGAGAKGKVVAALSYGLPVVSTPVGVEGAGLEEGRHVLVARSAGEMAASVLRLYHDADLWRSMSEAGQALVEQEFGLDMGRRKLAEAIEAAYRHKLGLDGAAEA